MSADRIDVLAVARERADLVNALSLAYALALHVPHGPLRLAAQSQLAFIRDTLAAATGEPAQELQDSYEYRAILQQNPQLGAKVGA